MLNGRTPRFGSYIDNILVSKASIKLTELIFGGVLAPKPRFSQKEGEISFRAILRTRPTRQPLRGWP